jgi:hypothetical protein
MQRKTEITTARDDARDNPQDRPPTARVDLQSASIPSGNGDGCNPFDPESFRLDESDLDQPAVKPELISLQVRRPEKFEFIRVCSDPRFRFGPMPYIELKRSRDYYIFPKEFRAHLQPREYWIGRIFLVTNTLEKPFLWVIKAQSPTGRSCDWYTSELECAERAMNDWVQVVAEENAYTVALAQDNLGEPVFPTHKTPGEIMELGFKHRYVKDLEHPVFNVMRGRKS